ncbi:hypothetical protein [Halopseudomonas pelagia]|uniref:Uncharacterized protein n=1 Tax=Halopseudomonas pelagia TaxID=553151 RepID=A0AA91U162_9GAMM|nr:hypothetical protein [Halopseudomonas pelagia]PCC98680.1 hypothetical protein CO192_14210 [Halopseudomonas pelagia]QFY56730.1 hypothetical protein EAO82_10315 [Halopseudomonas pelagia]
MIDWIETNQAVLSVCVSFATLLVWVIYAQLLYSGFRRQRTARVIINRGSKRDLDALCIVSNMSQEAIYVEYIIATLKTSLGSVTMDVTDFEQHPTEERENGAGERQTVAVTPTNIRENTRQGPLLSGEFMHIGTFSGLVQRLARQGGIPMQGNSPEEDIQLESLTIELIALYGPEPKPVSARRDFIIDSSKYGGTLTPASWRTRQSISFLQRRRLCKMVDEMNDTNFFMTSTIRREKR